jgi:hypothetical protein
MSTPIGVSPSEANLEYRRALKPEEIKQLFTLDGLKTLLGLDKRDFDAMDIIERRLFEVEHLNGYAVSHLSIRYEAI